MLFSRKKKILIVEDEKDIAEGIKARLDLGGYSVIMAFDGKEGVEKARSEKPDLILMDVMMPLLNGFDACEIIKGESKTKDIPIIVLTALPNIDDADKAFKAGANDFLNKPFTNQKLMEKIKKALEK